MRVAVSLAFLLAVACFFVGSVQAEEKEVTLKGTLCCCKCELKKADKCQTAIVVKEKDKEVIYVVMIKDEAKSKEVHKEICMKTKEGTVTGVVTEKDGKKTITATKVEFK